MYEIDRFDVGPGAYGIAFGPTGVVCVTLVEAGAVARIDPDGAVERVPLPRDGARPMVLAPGLDDDLFFSSGDGWIGRIDGAGTVTAVPVPLPARPTACASRATARCGARCRRTTRSSASGPTAPTR